MSYTTITTVVKLACLLLLFTKEHVCSIGAGRVEGVESRRVYSGGCSSRVSSLAVAVTGALSDAAIIVRMRV